jgi:hypothetical protein
MVAESVLLQQGQLHVTLRNPKTGETITLEYGPGGAPVDLEVEMPERTYKVQAGFRSNGSGVFDTTFEAMDPKALNREYDEAITRLREATEELNKTRNYSVATLYPAADPAALASLLEEFAPHALPASEPTPVKTAEPTPAPEPPPVKTAEPTPEPPPVKAAEPAPTPEPPPIKAAEPAPAPEAPPVKAAEPAPAPEAPPVKAAEPMPAPQPVKAAEPASAAEALAAMAAKKKK